PATEVASPGRARTAARWFLLDPTTSDRAACGIPPANGRSVPPNSPPAALAPGSSAARTPPALPRFPWQTLRIADRGNDGAEVFTVTHPFHPLRGQTFEILAVRNNWGGDRVSYLDTRGRLRTVPVEWTDIHAPDPVITVGAGRALFRADLLRQ